VPPGLIRPDCLSMASNADGLAGGGATAGLVGSADPCGRGDRIAAAMAAAAAGPMAGAAGAGGGCGVGVAC
jgi:hypothetical protein